MSKKALVIWEKVSPKISTERLRVMRSELGVPSEGLASEEDVLKWFETAQSEYNSHHKGQDSADFEYRLLRLVRFQQEISAKHTEIKYGFELPIFEKILSKQISEEIVQSSDDTGCRFVSLKENASDKIPKGVYLHIGQNTNIDDIERFLKGKSKVMQEHQLKAYGTKPLRYKPTKAIKNHYRDLLITEYGRQSHKEIKQILEADSESDISSGTKLTKEILIQRILKKSGFIVSTDNIKQIIRRKKRTLNRSEYM